MTHPTRRTGIVQDQRYANHCTGDDHPECPDRLEVLQAMMQEPDMREYFRAITPRRAEKKELLQVHSPKYIRRPEDTEGQDCTYLDQDTRTSPFSHETAPFYHGCGSAASTSEINFSSFHASIYEQLPSLTSTSFRDGTMMTLCSWNPAAQYASIGMEGQRRWAEFDADPAFSQNKAP